MPAQVIHWQGAIHQRKNCYSRNSRLGCWVIHLNRCRRDLIHPQSADRHQTSTNHWSPNLRERTVSCLQGVIHQTVNSHSPIRYCRGRTANCLQGAIHQTVNSRSLIRCRPHCRMNLRCPVDVTLNQS